MAVVRETSPAFAFRCPLRYGLHARPAARLAEVVRCFAADVRLTNERSGACANARSVLALIAADVGLDDSCRLEASGEGAESALEALRGFVLDTLPTLDEGMREESARRADLPPASFLETGASWIAGATICPGIGQGHVVPLDGGGLRLNGDGEVAGRPELERERLAAAVAEVRGEIEAQLLESACGVRADILRAQLQLADDVDLLGLAAAGIAAGQRAVRAVVQAGDVFAERLRAASNTYIRDRAVDVEGICRQIVARLSPAGEPRARVELIGPSVVVAEDLTPGELLALDGGLLKGLVLERTGLMSHVAILARSFGIPTLTNVESAHLRLRRGDEVVVDGQLGLVVREPGPVARRYYTREAAREARRSLRRPEGKAGRPSTRDGVCVRVGVNVGSAGECGGEVIARSDGIGLVRTELLFANHRLAPSLMEQVEVYTRLAEAAGGRPVVVRAFDVGADKPLAFLGSTRAGVRGVRAYAEHPEVFATQVRAVLRASAAGDVRLLVPMVTSVEDVTWVRERVAAAQGELRDAGVAFNPGMPVGIMVEVPEAVRLLEELCPLVDFLSIGTNDLAHHASGVDRGDPGESRLGGVLEPGFLRLVESIAEGAERHGRSVCVCGDVAGDAAYLPLLIGLGIREVSVVGPQVARIQETVGRLSAAECRRLADAALCCGTAGEVESLLRRQAPAIAASDLLDAELICMSADCRTQAETIKHLVGELFACGRTDAPRALEEDIWEREGRSSTGLGHGIAIPHCRTTAISSSAIAVARLQQPVGWNAIDGEPVVLVILLAMREADYGDVHMRVFSRLARRLMHEDFRRGLLEARDAATVHALLRAELLTQVENPDV